MQTFTFQSDSHKPVKNYSKKELQANYNTFMKSLTELSIKYGVIVSSVGGVHIALNPLDHQSIVYINEFLSGDLDIVWPGD